MTAAELFEKLLAVLHGAEGEYNKANVIFETVFKSPRLGFTGEISDADVATALSLASSVKGGYPVQYVAGCWPFMDFEVQIGEGVLIPRDDTVAVAETAIEACPANARVLDLCAGSGILGIAIARKCAAEVVGVELCDAAFEYLKVNMSLLAPECRPVEADVFTYQSELADGEFDLIVCNPPYLTDEEYEASQPELFHEPRQALCGGLKYYEHIIPAYRRCLKDGGSMVFEIGSGQAEAVCRLFEENGYLPARVVKDLGGNDRAVISAVEKTPGL